MRKLTETERAQRKVEIRAYQKQWRSAHSEELQDYARQYYQAHRVSILQKVKTYADRNREDVREKSRIYAQRPEVKMARLEYMRQYNIQHKDEHVDRVRQWRLKNPIAARRLSRTFVQARRARKRNAQGHHTHSEFLQKCTIYGWRCAYCRDHLTEHTVTEDHRIPLARGGTHWLSNMVPACKPCNSQKTDMTEPEFRRRVA